MILPQKHIKLSESLFGFGGLILQLIDEAVSIDDLWAKFIKYNNSKVFIYYHTFDNFILAIDYLYSIGAVNQDEKGLIYIETN